jgi:hypothetical protein
MREIKRRQNTNPAARTVAETIRMQALVMDRKGDASHCVLFFLLRVPKQSSARNKQCWGIVGCCVVNVLSNFNVVSLSAFLFCFLPAPHTPLKIYYTIDTTSWYELFLEHWLMWRLTAHTSAFWRAAHGTLQSSAPLCCAAGKACRFIFYII